MAVELPHTLQTCVGMVINNGHPQQRMYHSLVFDLDVEKKTLLGKIKDGIQSHGQDISSTPTYPSNPFQHTQDRYPSETLIEDATQYIQNPYSKDPYGGIGDEKVKRFSTNLAACLQIVSQEDLKDYIRTRTRFDLEQAAAVVVSALFNYGQTDNAVCLMKELRTLMTVSHMWVEPYVQLPMSRTPSTKLPNLAAKLQKSAAWKGQSIPLVHTYADLIPLLLRVRRCEPDTRALNVPKWLFEEANMEPPPYLTAFYKTQDKNPEAPRLGDAIILSRQHFRCIQRSTMRLFLFWKPDIRLRKNIKSLQEEVLYAGSWIEKRVLQSDNIALICHYFFHFQRRLQRKVVSDMGWTSFLAKGEGSKLFQNNVSIKSSFEEVLLGIAESSEEGVIVAMGNDNTLNMIDNTCMLMKEYVDVYGNGRKENLTFQKGVTGGSGRGPVDDYNLLCDVLGELRRQAKDEGIVDVPGPTHKFLAKDIMSWNNAWADDAFAGGKKAGWEDWLLKRGLIEDHGWGLVENDVEEKTLPIR